MSVTIESQLSTPIAFSKNIEGYKINTSQQKQCKARIFYEPVNGSNSFVFLMELSAFPDEDGNCFFYLARELEKDILQYQKPPIIPSLTNDFANKSLKRIRADFYEFDRDDYQFIDEAYHVALGLQSVDIFSLTSGEDYLIILESESLSAAPSFTLNGSSAKSATLLYQLADEIWYTISASADYNEIRIPPKTKAKIFKGIPPAVLSSDVTPMILGGKSTIKFGYIPLKNPRIISITFNGTNGFSMIASTTDSNPHNDTIQANLEADLHRYQIDYQVDNNPWVRAFSNVNKNSVGALVNIPDFDSATASQVSLRIRPIIIKDGSIIRYGGWSSGTRTF